MDFRLRPPEEPIKKAYDGIFHSGLSLAKIRDSALADRLLSSPGDAVWIAGRSIAWKLFLTSDEPLQSTSPLRPTYVLSFLRESRKKYADLLAEKMMAPDGTYEEGFVLPGLSASPKRPPETSGNLETNNPLSLHNENPWKEWFASVELRKTILQDVERTFPDIGFFRDPEVQFQLTNILFLYSVMNLSIGYRQGMHEVLASLYYAVDYDSIMRDESSAVEDPEMGEMCSRIWVAADAWALFESVMRGLSKWYEWREPPFDSTPGKSTSPLATHVHLNIPEGPVDIQPYVPPIVQACNRIQSSLLRSTDPVLWKHMQGAGIEPQIYGIRWLRLLFTREFSMPDAMKLWDGLFACDPTFDLAHWVCVAMLIRIRNQLISADYSNQLTVLIRYPYSSSHPSLDGAPHHATLLLRQALALQMSPTPSTGASLVVENRNLLNIPLEVPAPAPAPQRQRSNRSREKSVSTSAGRPGVANDVQGHPRQQSSQMGLPEMIARGLLERGESLGINKTFMSAVSELRRNIPDLASSLVRSPNASLSTFPLEDERSSDERPPWEARTRFEMEHEISQLKSTSKRLGESLEWIVDVLLQDGNEANDQTRLQKNKREALESLSYVRDVLMGNVIGIEEDRLVGEEESLRRKLKAEKSSNAARFPRNASSMTVPPVPVPVIDSRPKDTALRTHRPRSLPQTPLPVAGTFPRSLNSSTTPISSGSSGSSYLAPWNYTKSNFAGSVSTLPAASLPRLPPPTSTSLRRPSPGVGQKLSDQTLRWSETHQDPLGALQ